jgi:hypothetical protein
MVAARAAGLIARAVWTHLQQQQVMATKFSQFLNDTGIDPRRILAASGQIERLRPEDRRIKLQKRRGKTAEGGEAKAEPQKRRSGRPVTQQLLNAAAQGKPVSGPGKTRLLRAVNHVLAQKKKDPVDLRALF